MSITDGTHIPFIPLVDVGGNTGTVPPAQIDKIIPKLNVGTMLGLTVTTKVVVVAHWPAVGVKVYVAEFWLSTTAGLHVPGTPFIEFVGNVGTDAPEQIVIPGPKPNVGRTLGLIVTANETGVAH